MTDMVRTQYLADVEANFRKYKRLADAALARVSDEQFFAALDAQANSLAVLVKHMAGNLRSRWTDLLTADGEKPDRRRDAEFVIGPADERPELMRAWEHGWACVFGALAALTPRDLDRTVRIAGEPHSLVQALNRHLTHAAYHAGQIVLLAKHHRAGDWKSLSIARGESQRFDGDRDRSA